MKSITKIKQANEIVTDNEAIVGRTVGKVPTEQRPEWWEGRENILVRGISTCVGLKVEMSVDYSQNRKRWRV